MMPFLHDGSTSVTVIPTTSSSGKVKEESQQERTFVLKKVQRLSEGGGVQIHQVNHHPQQRSSSLTLAELQRKAAQRKLQMAKLMGHGGMGGGMAPDFRKLQGHSMMGMGDYQDAMHAASRRARSNNFTLNETFALLKIWASPEMQWQMKHNFRNFKVWEAIAFAMQELGHDRTAIQCKNRIQNLTSIFYRIKKSKQDYRSFNFPYYKIIGDVLDSKKNGNNNTMPPNMAEFMQRFQNTGVVTGPVSSGSGGSGGGSSGMAAHMALVEEYQHLINGNPEVTLTPAGERNNSYHDSSSGMNVLSPEVSISEGDSPVKVDMHSTNSGSPSAQRNHAGSSSNNRNSTANGSSPNAGGENEDGMMTEDGSVPSENDHDQVSDYDDGTMYSTEDEAAVLQMLASSENYGAAMRPQKRSVPNAFNYFSKPSYNGIPSKRPRGLSSATTASTGVPDDPIGQYLSEMVEIERQWLDMERDRAENERQMMIYMMQILQALVCPEQEQEEGTEEEGLVDGDGNEMEGGVNDYGEQEEEDVNEAESHDVEEQSDSADGTNQ